MQVLLHVATRILIYWVGGAKSQKIFTTTKHLLGFPANFSSEVCKKCGVSSISRERERETERGRERDRERERERQ